MKTYKVTFMGKRIGTKGPEYRMVKVVKAATPWHALMELFKTYEGVHFTEYEII